MDIPSAATVIVTTFQDLPVETFRLILKKLLHVTFSDWIKTQDNSPSHIHHLLVPLMIVSSEWNKHLIDKWLWTKIKRQIRNELSLSPRPVLISREEWSERPPDTRVIMYEPVPMVVIHSSNEPEKSFDHFKGIEAVKEIQKYHMDARGWADVGYNFLVDDEGRVYAGRGWKTVGAHTLNFNDTSYGICILGTFENESPTDAALKATQDLIDLGVKDGHIDIDYTLHGHRDLRPYSDSPGSCLYRIVQTWPHYESY